MKKSKIKKSMLAIPEPLWQCLLSSLLYKLSLSFWIRPRPQEKPPFSSSFLSFFLFSFLFPPCFVFLSKPLCLLLPVPSSRPRVAYLRAVRKTAKKIIKESSPPRGGLQIYYLVFTFLFSFLFNFLFVVYLLRHNNFFLE